MDIAADARIALPVSRAKRKAQQIPPQRVLLAAVQVPGRERDLADVIERMSRTTRHEVTTVITEMAPVGKFDNINRAIAEHDLQAYDWLLITDDDVAPPNNFLDLLIYFAHTYELKLAQPAHRFRSYISARIIERCWGSLARQTMFVENGPITVFHRDTFSELIPFASLRWAWGIDVFWSHIAKSRGWKMGVIDALPTAHLRPVGNSYDKSAAREEAEAFLRDKGLTLPRAEIMAVNKRIA